MSLSSPRPATHPPDGSWGGRRFLRSLCELLVVALAAATLATSPSSAASQALPAQGSADALGVDGQPGLSALRDESQAGGGRLWESPRQGPAPAPRQLADVLAEEAAKAPQEAATGFDPARSVEVVSQRSAKGTVYENPDGTFTARVGTRPVHYLKDGRWEDIDARVTAVAGQPGLWRTVATTGPWRCRGRG
jgi:hypothetical protein